MGPRAEPHQPVKNETAPVLGLLTGILWLIFVFFAALVPLGALAGHVAAHKARENRWSWYWLTTAAVVSVFPAGLLVLATIPAGPLYRVIVHSDWSIPPMLPGFLAGVVTAPVWAAVFLIRDYLRQNDVDRIIARQHEKADAIHHALEHPKRPLLASLAKKTKTHPPGVIRLGYEAETGRPFDLGDEVFRHVTCIGAPGSGKTETIKRLADGALAFGMNVFVIDAKGVGGLRPDLETLAARHGTIFRAFQRNDPASWTYDVCRGLPEDVANKILGAFSFGPEAQIYKNIAQEVLPMIVSGLNNLHEPITLRTIRQHLDPAQLAALGNQVHDEILADDLALLAARSADKKLYADALAGMSSRLGALLQGAFGRLLVPSGNVLDIEAATGPAGGMTYIALPATGASEDVALMARVLTQDLKRVVEIRLHTGILTPTLLIFDEFAALGEAEQLNDLLLQAREAKLACVISTQILPLAPALKKSLLMAKVLIVHQTPDPEDANILAAALGTEKELNVTEQTSEDGLTGTGSVKEVEAFRWHPNIIKSLPTGQAVVRSINYDALVKIERA